MKWILAAVIALNLTFNHAGFAQQNASVNNLPADGDYACIQRGPHSRIWRTAVLQTNQLGIVRTNFHSYTELATGLCYLENGQYVDSVEQINPVADGAQAVQGRHQVHWMANANTSGGAVTLTTPDGKTLRSTVYGLAYYDTASGSNVLLAQLQDSTATINSNTLTYGNAFSNLTADIRYTYRMAGFSQDIILRQNPPSPADYGLAPATTRLEVLTEFFDPPAPTTTTGTNDGLPDDRSLGFGNMKMGVGHAFLFQSDTTMKQGGAVIKQWTNFDNRTFLIEEIPYASISNLLSSLHSSSIRPDKSRVRRTVSLEPRKPRKVSSVKSAKPVKVVKAMSKDAALVLDYDLLSSETNYTFQGDTTYFVSGLCNLSGITILEGGTVIKFKTNTTAEIEVENDLVCDTASYSPAVFTSMNDNTVGGTITGSTGNPLSNNAGLVALNFPNGTAGLQNVRFSHLAACTSFEYYEGGIPQDGGGSLTMSNFQAVDCHTVVMTIGGEFSFFNGLVYNIGYLLGPYGDGGAANGQDVTAVNLTVHHCGNFDYDQTSTMWFTNCLFADVTNIYTISSQTFTNSTYILTNDSNVFQTVGAASHYLSTNSPYTNYGTTNISEPQLADLRAKTVYPPLTNVYGLLASNTTLSPQALRDTNAATVAVGYHYDPIDYALNIGVSNATLTVQPGTALAMNGYSYGVQLFSGGTFSSIGNASSSIHFVRYNTVQEGVGTNWQSFVGSFSFWQSASAATSVNFRFTDWSSLAGNGQYQGGLSPATFQDCQFYNGTIQWEGQSILSSNCLYQRVNLFLEANGTTITSNTFCNSLFREGEMYYYHATNASDGVWTFQDNLFDGTAVTVESNSISDIFTNNAWVTTDYGTLPISGGDPILTNSPDYEPGPLGYYYYPATQTNLIHKGSRSAADAGLYHYTVTTDNTIEGTNTVSIGFHYVATDTNGLPLISNTNGVPDYLADSNGNGIIDYGEIPWANIPLITSGPTNQIVWTGSNATFAVVAVGTLPLLYQWTFDGTNLVGATTSTYAITNVQSSNSGSYSVVITNIVGSVTSSIATLTVAAIAQPILNPPPGVYALIQNVTNTCSTPGITLRFTTNGTLPNSSSPVLPSNSVVTVPYSLVLQVAAFSNGISGPVGGGNYYIVGEISAGLNHALYLRPDGTVYAWGDNTYGQLGNGTTISSAVPVMVAGISNVTQIATSDGFSMALNASNSVFVWGSEGNGEAASSPMDYGAVPFPMALTNIVQIALGDSHALAVDRSGAVWSWGGNVFNQLGDDGSSDDWTPTIVMNGVSAVGAGYDFSLAISNGLVYGWGDTESFQLDNFGPPEDAPSLFFLSSITNAISEQGSVSTSYTLCSDGTVWACGDDTFGELGDGGVSATPIPQPVLGLSNVVSISASPDADYCLALTVDGTIWAWGANSVYGGSCGQLGNGSCDSTNLPTMVLGLSNIVSISAGGTFAMALKIDGTIWAWGDNSKRELVGFNAISTNVPVRIIAFDSPVITPTQTIFRQSQTVSITCVNPSATIHYTTNGSDPTIASPTVVSGATLTFTNSTTLLAKCFGPDLSSAGGDTVSGNYLKVISTISCGAWDIISLIQDGTVVGWGDNSEGEIGTNAGTSGTSWPVSIPGLSNIVAIAAGAYHSVALDSAGFVWTLGDNSNGQLGGRTNLSSATPVTITAFSNSTFIAAGFSNSLAILRDGSLWAWGNNDAGQLGIGDSSRHASPVQVYGITNAMAAAVGALHSLVLLSNGIVMACGDNTYGELGTGGTLSSPTPVEVFGLSNVVAVAAGENNSFALKSNGDVWAWGQPLLGTGNYLGSTVPIPIPGLSASALAVNGGTDESFEQFCTGLAVATNGTVFTWGDEQLTNLPSSLPSLTQVDFIINPLMVSVGMRFSAALMSDLTVHVWGIDGGEGVFGPDVPVGYLGPQTIVDDWNVQNQYISGDYYQGNLPGLVIEKGNYQGGALNSYFPEPLVVKVVDSSGSPLPNAPIVFTSESGGILLSSATNAGAAWNKISVLTDVNGLATACAYETAIAQPTNFVSATAASGTNVAAVTFMLLTNLPANLACWQFDNTNWIGKQAQQPLVASNLTSFTVPHPFSNAIAVEITNSGTLLSYRTVETNNQVNLTLGAGTVEFSLRPNWGSVSSGGGGPGVRACLLEAGSPTGTNWWWLGISSNGNELLLETLANGVLTTNIDAPIQMGSNQWYRFAVTYDGEGVACYLNGNLFAVGPGVSEVVLPGYFSDFKLGNDYSSGQPVKGELAEIQTYSIALQESAVTSDYGKYSFLYDLVNSLKCWLLPEVLTAVTNGLPLSSWPDSSQNGNGAMQYTTNSPPLFFTNIVCGVPALQFDGSNMLILSNVAGGWTEGSIFIVQQAVHSSLSASNGLGVGFWTLGGSGLANYYPFNNEGTNIIVDDFGSTTNHLVVPIYPLDQFQIYSASSSPVCWNDFVDGIPLDSTTNNTVAFPTNLILGASIYGPSNNLSYFSGYIAETLIFNRFLTSNENAYVEEYLINKYFTAPATPTNLTVIATSATNVDIVWTPESSNSFGYVLERSVGVDGGYTKISNVIGRTNCIDTIDTSSEYYYQIVAYNPYGISGTNAASIPLAALTVGLQSARYTNIVSRVIATWSSVTNAIASAQLFDDGSLFSALANSPAEIGFTNLPVGSTVFQLKATDIAGNSRISAPLSLVILDSNGDGTGDLASALMGFDPVGTNVPPPSPSYDPSDHTPPVITLYTPADAQLLP